MKFTENELFFSKTYDFVGRLSGIVTVPTDYDPEQETLPVILFLHGAGERGDGSPEQVQAVKVHGIPKLFGKDPDYHGLRVITLSPQCPVGKVWNQFPFQLMDWTDSAIARFGGDLSRLSITGLSMGGYGTWEMLMTFPQTFSCGAPICGGGISWRADALQGQKIRAFHGLDDPVVPFENSVMMVSAAKNNGADVTFTAYDKVGHASWENAYADQEGLVEWLISQKRG